MLNIPVRALKYILFQRTEFSIYQSYPWLLRLVMNKKIPVYNLAVYFESQLFPGRTRRLFSLDMERELSTIKEFLPKSPNKILDIGCGVAGIDIMLNKHYQISGHSPEFFLLDKSEVNSKVYYGLEKKAAYYNSLTIAKELLIANGIKENKVNVQEVDDKEIFSGEKFDLVISLISWGFHYPVETYLDYVFNNMVIGGVLIIDIRKGSGGDKLLEEKFGQIKVIYQARKFHRILVIKK